MVAVDANILQELLENRRWMDKVQAVIAQYTELGEYFAISTLSVSHIFYLAEAHKISMKRVEQLVAKYGVYDVVAADVDWALDHYKGKDFEDALQDAAARRKRCTSFLTFDALFAKKYDKYLVIELVTENS